MNGIENNEILLSICIPTYNRAEYLEQTIVSIIKQKIFQETNIVEIIVSDNCSEDNTGEVLKKYLEIYGDKIRYCKNTENIKDKNFEKVLSYGKGVFLKLNNDTLMHNDDTLSKMIKVINQNVNKKDILFFSNGSLNEVSSLNCSDLNEFVKFASFYSTWIACFGIWKVDFEKIDNFSRNAHLQLVQTDVLFRLIESKRAIYIDNSLIFNSLTPSNKGGYNIYKVFVTNYLGLYKEYRISKKISWTTLFIEKYKLMRYFLTPWTLTLWKQKSQFSFESKGLLIILLKEYWFHPFFYLSIPHLSLKLLIISVSNFKKRFVDK